MAVNKIRVKSESEYTIEVNDLGETISFDIADTNLAVRFAKSFDKVDELTKKYDALALEIDATPDQPHNEYITKNQLQGAETIDNLYKESREAMDEFLGEGACQKIFGDKNYYTMFEDLLDQLKPHLDKMGISKDKLKQKAVNKHSPNRAQKRAALK